MTAICTIEVEVVEITDRQSLSLVRTVGTGFCGDHPVEIRQTESGHAYEFVVMSKPARTFRLSTRQLLESALGGIHGALLVEAMEASETVAGAA